MPSEASYSLKSRRAVAIWSADVAGTMSKLTSGRSPRLTSGSSRQIKRPRRSGLIRIAREQARIGVGAETGPIGHADRTADRANRVGHERGDERSTRELDVRHAGCRGPQMQARREPGPVIERVRDQGHVGRGGENRDLLRLQEPRYLRHARLHDVGGAVGDQVAEPEHGRIVLARGDRNAQRRAHAREPSVVLWRPDGLLEPAELEALEPPADPDRLLDRPGAVRVEHQIDVVAGDLARHRDGLDVDLMQLDRGVAVPQRARDRLPDLARRVVAQEAGVDAEPRLAKTA